MIELWTNVIGDLMALSMHTKYSIHLNPTEEKVTLLAEIEECRERVRGLYDGLKNCEGA